MRLKSPFQTSFGSIQDKPFYLIEVMDELGNIGYGESVAFHAPWYTEETVETNFHIMKEFLIPLVLHQNIEHPDEISKRFSSIRRNNMAKAALEGAVWDLYAKRNKQTLSEALGGTRKKIEVGVSIGLQNSFEALQRVIQAHLQDGYKRIKVKIKPGEDVQLLQSVREVFPDIPLMADANSAYTLQDIELLQKLDPFDLLMIEQPLGFDDIVDHATLQKKLKTPICLDESIQSLEDARKAIVLGSAKVINIKIGRVGGLTEAKKIHDYCLQAGVPVWCGGMLEAGVGRAHNIALASLPNFSFPGDISGSSRYWERDIITPEIVAVNGCIDIPSGYGIGYELDYSAINQFTVEEHRW